MERAPGGAVVPGPTPSTVVLSECLPGFVAAPDGALNGPVSSSSLSSGTANPLLLTEISQGAISAYLRTWNHTYADGMGIVADLVVEFPDAAQTTAFLDQLESTVIGQFHGATSIVAAPRGAIGYSTYNQLLPHSTDFGIAFGRGDFASFVVAATPGGSVTTGQIQYMAVAQWDALPAATVAAPAAVGAPSAVAAALPPTLPATDLSSSGSGGLLAVVVMGLGLLLVLLAAVAAVAVVAVVGRPRRPPETTPS